MLPTSVMNATSVLASESVAAASLVEPVEVEAPELELEESLLQATSENAMLAAMIKAKIFFMTCILLCFRVIRDKISLPYN